MIQTSRKFTIHSLDMSAGFQDDGSLLLCQDCCIKAWELDGEELSLFGSQPEAHRDFVVALQFHPSSRQGHASLLEHGALRSARLLITAGLDGLIRAWRVNSLGAFALLTTSTDAHPEGITALCILAWMLFMAVDQ